MFTNLLVYDAMCPLLRGILGGFPIFSQTRRLAHSFLNCYGPSPCFYTIVPTNFNINDHLRVTNH